MAQFAMTAQHFSGPLPPPEMLRKYEDLLPGSADRVISMAERQSVHRQALEAKVVNSNCSNERLGMLLGFGVVVLVVSAGTYAVSIGKDITGMGAIVTALASLVGVFVYGKSQQKKELEVRQQGIIEAARQSEKK
jgi:uncharacterized membrane protein